MKKLGCNLSVSHLMDPNFLNGTGAGEKFDHHR